MHERIVSEKMMAASDTLISTNSTRSLLSLCLSFLASSTVFLFAMIVVVPFFCKKRKLNIVKGKLIVLMIPCPCGSLFLHVN